jgi:hypothetical protein
MNELKRRNLSGVYILHKFEDEEKKEPTCFEDCPVAVQDKWLESLELDAVRNLAKILGGTLREIGDQFDLVNDQGLAKLGSKNDPNSVIHERTT